MSLVKLTLTFSAFGCEYHERYGRDGDVPDSPSSIGSSVLSFEVKTTEDFMLPGYFLKLSTGERIQMMDGMIWMRTGENEPGVDRCGTMKYWGQVRSSTTSYFIEINIPRPQFASLLMACLAGKRPKKISVTVSGLELGIAELGWDTKNSQELPVIGMAVAVPIP
jgi:hypothetical protein